MRAQSTRNYTGHRTVIVAMLVVLSSFGVCTSAVAEDNEDKINESIEAMVAAEAHYEAEDYVGAAVAYQRAYGLFPQPELLEKVAKSFEMAMGSDPARCEDAEAAWRDFLRVCGDCDKKPFALGKVDDVSRQCAEHRAALEPDSTVTGQSPGPADSNAWIGWSVGGVGVATVLVGAGMHLSAQSTAADISRTDLDVYNRDVGVIESRERIAWVSYGLGMALITTAAILLYGDSGQTVGMTQPGVTSWAWSF